MDVDQPPGIVRNKAGRQNAHEAGQHHQRRAVRVNARLQRRVKSGAAFKAPVVQRLGGHAQGLRQRQPRGIGMAADHRHHPGARLAFPVLRLRRPDDCRHVGARTGNQDNNIF